MLIPETARLTESTDWIDLEFVERERTPREIVEKGIRYHLAELSLSNTVVLLEDFGVDQSRIEVHNWVQKADLQPADEVSPDHVALDQKMIQVNNDRYWLYAAVNPLSNQILHIRLFQTYSIYLTQQFLRELAEKHDVSEAVFLIDDTRELESGLRNEGFEYRIETDGLRNQVERIIREVERRTSSFSNYFSSADRATAETWLQAFTVWQNHA